MLNFIKKNFLLVLILLLGGIPASLNYSGFCIAEGRYLSDEEKIEKVINSNLIPYSEYIFDVNNLKKSNPIERYKNVQEFLEKNPNCCFMDIKQAADAGPPSFWSRIFNTYTNVIVANYHEWFIDKNSNPNPKPKQRLFFIDNCGNRASW